jgi:hypothetical protein
MRLSRHKKRNSAWDRRGELLKQRAAADTLRAVRPDAEFVSVELEFPTRFPVSHARQAHSLYPPAKALFVFPCPYGDCNGVYDLQSVALALLERRGKRSSGSLKCSGCRSREGASALACDLEVNYCLVARYEAAARPAAQASSDVA